VRYAGDSVWETKLKRMIEISHKEPGENTKHMESKNFKNWVRYLLDFVMLFFAVFLGFVAENIREDKADREIEKQFIQSYIEDLKSDTASLARNINYRMNEKLGQIDSLMLLLKNEQIKGNENELYYFGRILVRTKRFQSSDRTIIQLRNSGSLRLIENSQAADSIISYLKLVELIMTNQDEERDERNKAYEIASKMFDPFVFDSIVGINGVNRPTNNPLLRSYDRSIQLDLAAYAHTLKGSTYLIGTRLELLNRKAKNLIVLLRKEYSID